MPTEKPRVTFTVSKETLDEIDRYRFASRSKNQSQAILSLIERGLENCEKELKKSPPTRCGGRGAFHIPNRASRNPTTPVMMAAITVSHRFAGCAC